MTTMNNEDPADQSVHEARELPEPVAYLHDVVAADCEPDQALSFAPDNFPLMGVGGFRSVAYRGLYTADQMREAIAAERERQTKPPTWWTCPTHGDAQPNAWGCPECVREMRGELVTHAALELEQAERIAELEARLKEIGDYAHDNSTGPAVPDALWTIREMAYDG